jgi:hypothetical protein|tara:strand:+ start:578 stop:793 length:216 start_codon:yes stop_codon:yes gene_type:complete
MPFLNLRKYLINPEEVINKIDNIEVKWDIPDNIKTYITLNEDIEIILEKGKKPGWSNKVQIDGPLAKQILS